MRTVEIEETGDREPMEVPLRDCLRAARIMNPVFYTLMMARQSKISQGWTTVPVAV